MNNYIILFTVLATITLWKCKTQKEDDSKHKGIVFQNWILDLDDLKITSSKDSVNVIWNVNDEIEGNNFPDIKDSIIVKDEKKEKYKVLVSDKTDEVMLYYEDEKEEKHETLVSDVHYVVQLKKDESGEIIWTYSPHFFLPLGGKGLKCIVNHNKLIIMIFSPTASGAHLFCVDIYSGEEIWKGDIKQLLMKGREYSNAVFIKLIDNKIVLVGNETGGNYIQVIDASTGKNLFTKMNKD